MNKLRMIAFICYTIVAVFGLLVGGVYFISSKVMPYHEIVIGTTWDMLKPGYQDAVLGMMNLVGIFSFSLFLAGLIILIIPFRKGESWTRWTLPVIFLPSGAFVTNLLIYAYRTYNSPSPWKLFVVMESFLVLGFIFSILDARQK
jgi:hypothetical protein